MKIVCISDTHSQHAGLQLPAGDVLIHAGDHSVWGQVDEAEAFLAWFAAQPHRYKIFIAGNHDFIFEKRRRKSRTMVPAGVVYLEDEGITVNGLKFWGSPVTPKFNDWAFMHGPTTIGSYWDAVPDDTDVLISHGPAYGVMDQILPHLNHVGCEHLRVALDTRLTPRLHVFGHIHEGYGMVQTPGLVSVNASVLDHTYQRRNNPVVVTLDL